MTPRMLAILDNAIHGRPLGAGRPADICPTWTRVATELRRKGWVDEAGKLTGAGRRALARHAAGRRH